MARAMNKLVYLIILSAFLLPIIVKQMPGGAVFRIAPEMLSALVLVIVALRVGLKFPVFIFPRYLLFFIIFLLVILAGVAINAVQPGAVFAGMLIYLRYIPFFLLPLVCNFSEEDMSRQLKLVLGCALLQFPVSFFQRFVQFSNKASGDVVVGTLGLSSNLSIVLIGCAAILMGFYLKRYISVKKFILVLFLLLMPTMINETTISLFLIPVALIVPVLFVRGKEKVKYLLQIGGIAAVLLVVFVAVYNSYYTRWGGNVLSVITEGKMTEYVYKGADEESRTGGGLEHSEIGRVDSMVLPFKLINDPVKLLIGHGIGNVSDTATTRLQGEYISQYGMKGAGMTTVSYFIWEIGLFGLGMSILMLLLFLKDAVVLSRSNDIYGAIALGWPGVTVLLLIVFAYQNIIPVASIGLLFWYMSGVIVSRCFRMQRQEHY